MSDRGERNNNPGNIDKGQGFKGEVPGNDNRFATFCNAVMGIRAIAVILIAYADKHGINTVRGVVTRWAPPSENDTDAYVTDAAAHVGVSPDSIIDLTDPGILEKATKAIIFHENGECVYTDQQIEDAIDSALA